jgi:hypothetical protein
MADFFLAALQWQPEMSAQATRFLDVLRNMVEQMRASSVEAVRPVCLRL